MSLSLADVPVPAVRRALLRAVLLVLVVGLFVAMVAKVALAALLAVVVAVFLRPVYRWLVERIGSPAGAGVLTLLLIAAPALAILTYGYLEVRGAALYLAEHAESVAAEIQAAVATLPFLSVDAQDAIRRGLLRAADYGTGVPEGLQDALGAFGVATAVFLFTAFYVLTEAETIVGYLQSRVPARYATLTEHLERTARGVLYGAVYATLVSQTLKGLWMLALFLVFGVPLPFTLALIAFVIGFFPVVGTWTVYLPAAGWLLVFDDSPVAAGALVVLAFLVSTPLLSFYVRPKLAADASHVLDFYWMFIGLIAGVYAFGIPGVVLGPVVVGLLKALLDVITDDESWREPDADGPEATVLTEEVLADEGAPQRASQSA